MKVNTLLIEMIQDTEIENIPKKSLYQHKAKDKSLVEILKKMNEVKK